jgi:hypothetical protein
MTDEVKDEPKMLGTKEIAARLKLKPKTLRSLLRKISGKAFGERYEWKLDDPFLKKLPAMIKEQKTKAKKGGKR